MTDGEIRKTVTIDAPSGVVLNRMGVSISIKPRCKGFPRQRYEPLGLTPRGAFSDRRITQDWQSAHA